MKCWTCYMVNNYPAGSWPPLLAGAKIGQDRPRFVLKQLWLFVVVHFAKNRVNWRVFEAGFDYLCIYQLKLWPTSNNIQNGQKLNRKVALYGWPQMASKIVNTWKLRHWSRAIRTIWCFYGSYVKATQRIWSESEDIDLKKFGRGEVRVPAFT